MKNYIDKLIKREFTEMVILTSVVLVGFVATVIGFVFMAKSFSTFKSTTASTTNLLVLKVKNLEEALATTTLTSQELAQRLADQQNKSNDLESTLSDIGGTVGNLEKLSKTDKELLQKYSKVYFLSDNYVPLSLENIDKNYLNDQTKNMQFHTSALPFLDNMIEAAASKDINLKIVSAYRSFGTQSSLKASYLVTYGSGANTFAADQGYSEHQLGTTVDLTAVGQATDLAISFENSTAFDWLSKNAYRYGFILSYPKGNKYYQYEPWHWRFVGRSLATKLHREGLNFSDMDQREIDTYLVKIFD